MEIKESYISVINTADDLWAKSIEEAGFSGDLILAYKNTQAEMLDNDKEVLYEVIVKRIPDEPSRRKYTVNVVTSRRAYTLNHLPPEYILGELVTDLEKFEVGGDILSNFKQVIKDIEE